MEKKYAALALKSVIWACLGVIFFSVLFVFSNLFFPFITSKTIAFQIAVEVMFVAFLLLCLVDEKYRLHTNLMIFLLLVYLIILTVASAFSGNDFYHSFWSNNEREDGILLLLHLFLFSWVLTGFFRSLKEWLYVFDLFLIASFCVAIVALDQYLALEFPGFWSDHFIPSSNGARLAATIGNAGYVGGYMVFGIFLSLFMLLKRNNLWLKIWYGFLFLLELFIAVQTQTRGAYIAIALGLVISAVYLLWFYFNDKRLKIALISGLVIFCLGVFGIFYFKNSSLVVGNSILSRIASISINDVTGNNRFVTWQIGWRGFKERPILGYGQENFYQVFDKYYTTKNSEQWFDRCHNMVCDRAITGGIIGLLAYLSLLLLPFGALWKYYWQEFKNKVNDQESLARRFLIPIIFTILILAYIIQNLFIFEALATYVPLIMVLSFVGLYSASWDFSLLSKINFKNIVAVLAVITLAPSIWLFNLKPVYANIDFIKALAADSSVSLSKRIDAFEEVISRNTMGNQEYRRHYFSFYESVMSDYANSNNRNKETDELMASFSSKVEKQLDDEIQENPYSIGNYLVLMRFYNISYYFDISRLAKAIELSSKIINLSPGRPQIYYEVATSNYYLGSYYASVNKKEEAKERFASALKMFYDGARANVDANSSFDQLISFLAAIKNNKRNADIVIDAIVQSDYLNGLLDDLESWANSDNSSVEEKSKRLSAFKEILQWLSGSKAANDNIAKKLKALE